jgi:hypothetical protein
MGAFRNDTSVLVLMAWLCRAVVFACTVPGPAAAGRQWPANRLRAARKGRGIESAAMGTQTIPYPRKGLAGAAWPRHARCQRDCRAPSAAGWASPAAEARPGSGPGRGECRISVLSASKPFVGRVTAVSELGGLAAPAGGPAGSPAPARIGPGRHGGRARRGDEPGRRLRVRPDDRRAGSRARAPADRARAGRTGQAQHRGAGRWAWFATAEPRLPLSPAARGGTNTQERPAARVPKIVSVSQ